MVLSNSQWVHSISFPGKKKKIRHIGVDPGKLIEFTHSLDDGDVIDQSGHFEKCAVVVGFFLVSFCIKEISR